MQVYLVGGAVRDALMGLAIQDRDWVVVGSTAEQMQAQGFIPVGRDFPVFLHPTTKEEYALARTERKTGPGYRGFVAHAAPEVTLEEDLARRDLTVNAMAVPATMVENGAFPLDAVIDPFGGRRDVEQRVLRHVTTAFREDPVRILRLARFCARFFDFSIAPETWRLVQDMVNAGEADHLIAERVWQELARGLMESRPSRMLDTLLHCGALARLAPQLTPSTQELQYLDSAAAAHAALPVRFACLVNRNAHTLATVLRAPSDCVALAQMLEREHDALHASAACTAQAYLQLLERCDALRKPARFEQLLQAWAFACGETDHAMRTGTRLRKVLAAASAVATKSIATNALQTGANGVEIGKAIDAARVSAIAIALESDTVF